MKNKGVFNLSLIVGYIILAITLTLFLPKILSFGRLDVETVLTTGKTAAISVKDIDISTADKAVKKGQTIYLSKGVENRLVISHKKTELATIAKVMDVSGNTARVQIFMSNAGNKWTPGVSALQFILLAFLFIIPIIIIRKYELDILDFKDFKISKIPMPTFPSSTSRKNTRDGKKYGDQGSSKEGKLGDLRRLSGDDGFVISKNFRLSRKFSFEHVVIIGPTGAGKSSTIYIPNLLDFDNTISGVVVDPKGELEQITKPYLNSIGVRTISLWPLKGKDNKFRYNPLLIAETTDDVSELAQTILTNGGKSIQLESGSTSGGAEWINMALPLFVATLIYVKKYGKRKSITEAVDIILSSDLKEFDEMFKIDKEAYRKFCIFRASSESEKTMSSIKSVLTTNVAMFTDTTIEDFTTLPMVYNAEGELVPDSKSAFFPKMLREKSTVLFICVPERKSNYAMPLMSVIFSQLFNGVLAEDGIPVFFMLDEFANIGIIPSITTICATARSREVGLAIAIQTIEQLVANYGESNADTILTNLKTKVFFPGLTGRAAEYASKLAGQTTVETKNYSTSSGGQDFISNLTPNVSKTGTRRELITTDEMRTMDDTKVLIIAHNINPVFDTQNKYYTQERYKSKLSK